MKTEKILTLWLPNLLSAAKLQDPDAQLALKQLPIPSLKNLLAKADKFPVKPMSFEAQACHLAHLSQAIAVAPLTASIDLPNFDADYFWLRCDPVQLMPDRDQLVCLPGEGLNVQPEEAQALIEAFNQHFAQDAVQIEYGAPLRWYLRIKQTVDIQSTPLAQVVFQSVGDAMPKGNAATYWRQLLNETQMLFYTHPVNEARRDNGLPEINSIWIWGEGSFPKTSLMNASQSGQEWSLVSDHVYIKGLAHFMKASHHNSAKNYQAWLNLEPKTRNLVCLESDLNEVTLESWLEHLKTLEQDWFAPLEQALRNQEVSSVLLDLGLNVRFHLTPKHLKKFWRLSKSLHYWA